MFKKVLCGILTISLCIGNILPMYAKEINNFITNDNEEKTLQSNEDDISTNEDGYGFGINFPKDNNEEYSVNLSSSSSIQNGENSLGVSIETNIANETQDDTLLFNVLTSLSNSKQQIPSMVTLGEESRNAIINTYATTLIPSTTLISNTEDGQIFNDKYNSMQMIFFMRLYMGKYTSIESVTNDWNSYNLGIPQSDYTEFRRGEDFQISILSTGDFRHPDVGHIFKGTISFMNPITGVVSIGKYEGYSIYAPESGANTIDIFEDSHHLTNTEVLFIWTNASSHAYDGEGNCIDGATMDDNGNCIIAEDVIRIRGVNTSNGIYIYTKDISGSLIGDEYASAEEAVMENIVLLSSQKSFEDYK